jgi:hypothetical protein
MAINEIRKRLQEVKDNREDFSWVDEEIVELLLAVAEHLIFNTKKDAPEPQPSKEFMWVKEFEKKYKFVSAHTLYKYCQNDPAFADQFGWKVGTQWYVNEDKTLDYLKTLPTFKKRLERLGNS